MNKQYSLIIEENDKLVQLIRNFLISKITKSKLAKKDEKKLREYIIIHYTEDRKEIMKSVHELGDDVSEWYGILENIIKIYNAIIKHNA